MATHWTEEKYQDLSPTERNSETSPSVHPESHLFMPIAARERPLTSQLELESLVAFGAIQWKTWPIGWNMLLAALAGILIFLFLSVSSISVVGSAVSVAGVAAGFGLAHSILCRRALAQEMVRERRRIQDHIQRLNNREIMPSDELRHGLDDRERKELSQILEHSLTETTGGQAASADRTAIRRDLREKFRMFGDLPRLEAASSIGLHDPT